VPRLEQVVVDVDQVDGVDRRVGVGIRREQHPAGQREEVHRGLEELDAVHLGHAVVGQQQGNLVAAQLDLAQRLQRLVAGAGPDHPVPVPVPPPHVARDGPGHGQVVVDGQDRGVGHTAIKARSRHHRRARHILGPRAKHRRPHCPMWTSLPVASTA
jgi:hypothetical protein